MSSYRTAAFALAILLVAFFAPVVLRGHVIYPHDNALELGVREAGTPAFASNRKFSDQSSVYVPEIHHHLHGDHEAWISTWNPHVELGRPSMQISGLSPAFPITRVLSWLTSDALRLATWIAVLDVALIACFAFLFLRSLELHPWACFAGGALMSMSIFTTHYLNVVMLLATFAWTLALLWLITCFVKRRTIACAASLSCATYALFMTGYPQQIVWHAYFIGAFAIQRVLTGERAAVARARILGGLAVAAAIGVALCAPVYLDLMVQAQRSARLDADPEFFLARLPVIQSFADMSLYFARFTDALWEGNPITIEDLDTFSGISFTPVCVALCLLAWMDGEWRRSWPWLAFAGVTFLMTVWHAAYLFGVDHLGLSLSRTVPLRAGVIPWTVAAALALDRILRHGVRRRVIAVVIVACVLANLIVSHARAGSTLSTTYVALSAAIFAAVIALIVGRQWFWAPLIVVATVFHYGQRMLLVRPESTIHRTSPLADKLRELTAGGVRYAAVGVEEPRLLPPNQEGWLDLSSIHSYNPLSSLSYQEWTLRLSQTRARTYGRQFRRIASEKHLSEDELTYSGIGVLVSARKLASPRFTSIGEIDGVHLYRPIDAPIFEAQIAAFERTDEENVRIEGALTRARSSTVSRTADRDDHLSFSVTPSAAETLLFVSQQHHPDWRASSNGRALTTVRVNEFFQGVVIPADTSSIELEFRPYARWSFIPAIAVAILAAACLIAAIVRRTRSSRLATT